MKGLNTKTLPAAFVALLALGSTMSGSAAMAAGKPTITGANSCTKLADAFSGPAVGGETVLDIAFDMTVGNPESVVIATSCDGNGGIVVDDALELTVSKHDSSGSVTQTWHGVCRGLTPPSGPVDVTSLFSPGRNTVHLRLYDICGGGISNPDLYLVVRQHA